MATATSVKTTNYYNGRLFHKGDTCNFSIKETDPSVKHFNLKDVAAATTADDTGDTSKTKASK